MNILVVLGASVVVLLGVVHTLYTFRSTPRRGPFASTDPHVREAMQRRAGLGLARDMDAPLWRPWIGFHLSHSLGVVAVGLFILIPAWTDFAAALAQVWWVVLALLLPALYLVISLRYWFHKPTIGIVIANVLIATGIVGGLIRS